MNKEKLIITGFSTLYNQLHTLNSLDEKDSKLDIHPSEVHCIEQIKRIPDANVTKLAEASFMTKGAISKITKKLLKYDAIEIYKNPDNKKEIYFKLTNFGEEIFKSHEEMHKKWNERDRGVYDAISEADKDVIISFLEKYNKHLEKELNKHKTL